MSQRPISQFLHERSAAPTFAIVNRSECRGERHALEHVSDGKRRLLLFYLHVGNAGQPGVGAPKHLPGTTPCPAANAAAGMRRPLAGCNSRSRNTPRPQPTSMPSLPVARTVPAVASHSFAIGSALHTLTPAPPNCVAAPGTDAVWPKRTSFPTQAQLGSALGQQLEARQLLLGESESHGYLRDWRAAIIGFGPERHVAYALQWWGLAALIAYLYLFMNLECRP